MTEHDIAQAANLTALQESHDRLLAALEAILHSPKTVEVYEQARAAISQATKEE